MVPEPDILCMVSRLFFCAEQEAEARFALSPYNFFLISKTCISVFQAQISLKNSKKFTEMYFITIKSYEFFQNFWSQYALKKNVLNFQ